MNPKEHEALMKWMTRASNCWPDNSLQKHTLLRLADNYNTLVTEGFAETKDDERRRPGR